MIEQIYSFDNGNYRLQIAGITTKSIRNRCLRRSGKRFIFKDIAIT